MIREGSKTMLHIFGEALLLLVGQGRVQEQRDTPEGRRREGWRKARETPRLR
jgi:hypothetical protein